jgi:hypothetical protein
MNQYRKSHSRTSKVLISIILSICLIVTMTPTAAFADEISIKADGIQVDPTIQYQDIEGWGTAICWWGNLVGTWQGIVTDWSRQYGEGLNPPIANMEVRDALIHMMYSPEGCNMNVARYIIGGGDGDDGLYSNTFIKRPDSRAVGWSLDLYGHADGTNFGNIVPGFFDKDPMMMQDWGQLYVLKKAAELRTDADGNCDLIVETFANSAPYYMTISGHTSGSVLGTTQNGNGQNLQEAWYGRYADYMASVTKYIDKYLNDNFGIHVTATDPFNEPSVGWGGATNATTGPSYAVNSWPQHFKQEGMMVSVTNQSRIINEFTRAYREQGIDYIPLTPSGDTNQSTTVNTYNGYTESARAETGILSTHSYGVNDNNRRQLRDLTGSRDTKMWQAEVGFGPGTGQPWAPRSMSYTNTMTQADVMIQDLKLMGCTAWVNWIAVENNYQMMAEGTNWGLIHGNLSSPVGKKNFSTGVVTFDDSGTDVFGQPLKDPMYFNRLLYNTLTNSPGHVASSDDPKYGTWKTPADLVSTGVTLELAQSDWYREPAPYEFHFTKQFYIQQQFSKYIKQGYTIIDIASLGITNANALAAISPDRTELILEAKYGTGVNPATNILAPVSVTIDLTRFPNADTAEVYRTKDDEVVDGTTVAWDGRRMDDIDVSDGTLQMDLVNKSVTTYKITNKYGLPLFTDGMVYNMANSELMFAVNTGTTSAAQTAIQAYVDSGRYTDLNKFNYKRADGSPNGSNITNTTAVANGWSYVTSGVGDAYSAGVRRASADGASFSFKFDSDRFVLLGQKISTGGQFSVKLDGEDKGTFSTANSTTDNNAVLFDTGVLADDGPHLIEVAKIGATGTVSVSGAKLGYGVTSKASDGLIDVFQFTVDDLEATFPKADYTPASYAPFEKALAAARAIIADPVGYSDDDVYVVWDALLDAASGLVRIADKSGLKTAIDYATDLLKPANVGKYIPVSVENLEDVLSGAAIVYADADATQAKVDKANEDLLKAIGQVYEKGDKAGLQALVTLVSRYVETNYTPATWGTFTKALDDARTVIANPNAVADSVNKAYTALSAAVTGLTRKADFAALNASIAIAQQIVANIGDYVPSTVVGLAEELDGAKAVSGNPDASQAQVNAAAASLNAKILAARLKPDLSGLLSETTGVRAVEEGLYSATSDTVISKGKISKITVSGKSKIAVKWAKASATAKVAGYQVQYRVKGTSKWKSKTVSAKSTSLTIKNLKKNKKYQIRVRAYRSDAGTKQYGAWSAVKSSKQIK